MKRMFLMLAVLLVGCSPAKVVTEFQRDTLIYKVVDSVYVRDTVVMAEIPAESGANVLPDTDTSYLSTSLAESRAFVENGRLYHTLRNRSEMLLPVKVQYVDRARSERTEQIGWRQTVETIEVEKQLSRWQNFIMALGYVVLIAVVIWAIRTLYKYIKI